MRLRISLLGMNEAREQHRIANEENRRVVASHIPDSVFRVEFQCKATGIAKSISRATFTTLKKKSDLNQFISSIL